MFKQVRLPHDVASQVLRVLQPRLREMGARPVHVAECYAALLSRVWSVSCHALQFSYVVDRQTPGGENVTNMAHGLRLERDDVCALIQVEHRFDRAELGGIG